MNQQVAGEIVMLNQDLSRFAILMTGTGEIYDKPITQVVIEAYWNIFKDFAFKDVDKAFHLHHKNPDVGKYFPKPADIIMAIEGSSQNQALRAWTKVISAVQSIGVYSSVAFDDPLIHAVIEDMRGWQKFGTIDAKQLPFIAKEFQDRYRGYVINKPCRHPKYLVGIIEGKNNLHGYMHDPPVLIGDEAKAKQIIATGNPASVLGDNMEYKSMLLENRLGKYKKLSVLKIE